MKKLLSLILAICLVFALGTTSFAADTSITNNPPITVRSGTIFYDQAKASASLNTLRGNALPTSFAPSTWYGLGINHSFNISSYTFSNYKFTQSQGDDIDLYASGPVVVTFYYANGTYLYSGSASAGSPLMVTIDADYYCRVDNYNSGTVSGYYCVY